MALNNTTGNEDRTLKEAENFNINEVTLGDTDRIETLIQDLVVICESLDDQIGDKDDEIESLNAEIKSLEQS